MSGTHIDSQEMARLIEENLSAKSTDFAKLDGGSLHTGNPTWFMSNLKRSAYNGVTLARFSPDRLDEQIESCLEPFRENAIPLTWWVGPLSEPASLGRALQLHGFSHVRDMTGMAARLDDLAECPPLATEYSFEPVPDRGALEKWLPLFMETFGLPTDDAELISDVFAHLSFSSGANWRHYFIQSHGQVLATGSLHLGGGVAGLYNIATCPEYRQHGLGRAITLLIYEQARQMGYTLGTLQTTYPNALRLYHRIGFEVYCKFGMYQCTW
ncbi:MAG TPA: GNAT family N-acetyltransferase [Anaerolineales bacterium]|nr:GNAT family N-acetyltransferase [Anaerolineales bacterium]